MKEIYRINNEIFYHATWQDRSGQQQFKHSLIHPKNTYSPWLGDEAFLSVYNRIKEVNTLVDIFRCYDLWDLARQLKQLPGAVIEVGVWRGGTGALLAKAIETKEIYLCDTFEGVVKATAKDTVYKGGEHADTSIDIVNNLMAELNLNNYKIIQGIFPEDSGAAVEANQFCLCHIDVDVYQSAKDIFNWVWPKLVVGGAVVFDDYGFAACEGITQLVHDIVQEHKDLIKIYNINGHAILIKTHELV